MKALFARIAACLFAAASIAAHAGGPLGVCAAVPTKYPGAGVVTLNYDGGGTLGTRSKAAADALVTSAVSLWTNVTTSTAGFARGPDLVVPNTATPVDVTTANYLTYIGNNTYNDGINPVVYDTNGTITDSLLGSGASNQVLGFAGSAWYDYGTYCQYAEGRAVINGKLAVSDTTMSVVLAHEMGHLIGMDHTQIDSAQGLSTANYPLMYPIAYRGSATLHEDDVAAVTALYPDVNVNSVYGTLSGTFVTGGGTPILGTNIWARNNTTNQLFSVVSDYVGAGGGYFKLLLTPGSYTLYAEAIDTAFTDGSGVGPYSLNLGDISFQPPNYSGANGTGTPLAVTMTTPITITAGCNATVTFRSTGSGTMGTTCAPPATPSAMTSPANGSTLAGSSVTFSWNAGVGTITERLLMVGTTLGGSEIYSGYQGAALSRTVTGIPTNGSTIYVRLMSFINGSWQTNNYTYTAANVVVPTPSVITAPTPGTTLSASAVNFEWSAGGMVTSRTLSVGSTLGGSQYYGPANQGSALSVLVINLPTNGSTVYVRLSQVVNGVAQSTDYTYTAATVATPSTMTSPANGSTLAGASVTFNWNAGSGVTERYFTVGSANGGSDIYAGYQGAALSRTVTVPTDGRTIYVRLASWVGGAWSNANYTYTASGTGAPPPCTTAPSAMNSPASGSTLPGASVTFGWTAGCNVTERYLSEGSTAGAGDIYGGYQGAGLSRNVATVPTDGRTIYVTLSSWVGGAWQSSNATYTAFGTGGAPKAPAKSEITSPTPGSTLPGASVTIQWDAGSAVSERYLSVGSSAGAGDIYGGYQGAGLSRAISTMPTDGRTVYVTLSSWVGGGWQTATATYRAASGGGGSPPAVPQSVISSPAPGSTLGSSATFNWSAGSGVTERYFTVGTTSGGTQIYGGYQGAGLSRTVSGLPTGSVTIYVRLMSYVGGSWIVENYTYTSAP